MIHWNEHLQAKVYGLKDALCGSLEHTAASTLRFFFMFFCLFWVLVVGLIFFFNLLNFGFGEERLREQRTEARGQEMTGIWMHDGKSTKNQ